MARRRDDSRNGDGRNGDGRKEDRAGAIASVGAVNPVRVVDERERNAEQAYDTINLVENRKWSEVEDTRPTRGEKKRRAFQLEELGEALVKLKPGQLARVPLPQDLKAAVEEAQRILEKKARGGYRRQIQFIGKIMRTVDAGPLQQAYDAITAEGTMASAAFQAAERWRTRLLAEGDDAVEELCRDAASIDRTALRQLVRAAQKEAATTTPGAPGVARKKLFRLVREALEPDVDAGDDDASDEA